MIGAARSLTQLFAYEIPLFLSILAPALLADTWSLSEHDARSTARTRCYAACNVIGFGGRPGGAAGQAGDACRSTSPRPRRRSSPARSPNTAAGCWPCSGMAIDIEMVVGASLLAAVFLPFGLDLPAGRPGSCSIWSKSFAIVCLMSSCARVFARLRIDQMVNFCWKYRRPGRVRPVAHRPGRQRIG